MGFGSIYLSTKMVPTVSPDLDRFYPKPGMKLKEGRYEALRQLGEGRHSTVWLVSDTANPCVYDPLHHLSMLDMLTKTLAPKTSSSR